MAITPLILIFSIILFIRRCFPEEEQSQQEHNGKASDTGVDFSGNLADDGNEEGSEEGGAFTADIQNSEVFSGFFCRNDLGKLGTGQGLDRTLKHANQDCEDPEFGLRIQSDGIECDTEVSSDTNADQGCRIVFGRNPSEQECTWKGNDLG